MTHPALQLDDAVHQRVRLGILAVLHEARQADFLYLREALDLSDGNLARHLQVLEKAGLVKIEKDVNGRRPRTWARATKLGRAAFAAELASLRKLISQVDGAG